MKTGIFFGGLVAAAVAVTALPLQARAADIRVAVVTGVLDGLLPVLGEKQGIFKKHDLDVSLIRVKNGPELISALASGSADFAEAAPTIAFPAIARGGEITYLMNNYDLDYSLLAQPKVKILTSAPLFERIRALKGLRIGVVGRGGVSEMWPRKLLAAAGLNPETDATYIATGAGLSAASAFQNNQVDVLVSLPPMEFLIGTDNYQLVVGLDEGKQVFGRDFMLTGMAANTGFVKKNPAVTLRYCQAFKETTDFLHNPQNRKVVVEFLAAQMNLTEDKATSMFDTYKSNWNTRLTEERWNHLKSLRNDVPEWSKAVHQPCADLSVK